MPSVKLETTRKKVRILYPPGSKACFTSCALIPLYLKCTWLVCPFLAKSCQATIEAVE